MSKYDVYFKGNHTVVEAEDMLDAKRKGVKFFSVSKRDMGLMAIQFHSEASKDMHFL